MRKIAFFDAKPYDKPGFETFGQAHNMKFKYYEPRLNADTAELARGCDAVCAFVNDTLDGAVLETFCQQLKTIEDLGVYYYTNDRGSCEIDFIVDTGEQIIPVEVKAETNLRAKSLKTYQEKFAPEIAVRASMADFKKEDRIVNLPLYAVEQIVDL